MEFKSQDVEAFLCEQSLGRVDGFGSTFLGRIPRDNAYGLNEMDVAIRVSNSRTANQAEKLNSKFNNELKLCSLKHRNIIGLIGYSETNEKFYLVYEMVQARPLSEVIEGLTWEQALKILKGTVSGLAFLHSHPEGPFVHSNVCLSNILVTKDFVPKIIDFTCCIVEGKEGTTSVREDVFAFGLLALQLITKDKRAAYAVEEEEDGSGVSLHHILDLYVPLFKENKGNLVHASYGQEKESRKVTKMIFDCLKKDSQLHLESFRKDLILLSLAKQC